MVLWLGFPYVKRTLLKHGHHALITSGVQLGHEKRAVDQLNEGFQRLVTHTHTHTQSNCFASKNISEEDHHVLSPSEKGEIKDINQSLRQT